MYECVCVHFYSICLPPCCHAVCQPQFSVYILTLASVEVSLYSCRCCTVHTVLYVSCLQGNFTLLKLWTTGVWDDREERKQWYPLTPSLCPLLLWTQPLRISSLLRTLALSEVRGHLGTRGARLWSRVWVNPDFSCLDSFHTLITIVKATPGQACVPSSGSER